MITAKKWNVFRYLNFSKILNIDWTGSKKLWNPEYIKEKWFRALFENLFDIWVQCFNTWPLIRHTTNFLKCIFICVFILSTNNQHTHHMFSSYHRSNHRSSLLSLISSPSSYVCISNIWFLSLVFLKGRNICGRCAKISWFKVLILILIFESSLFKGRILDTHRFVSNAFLKSKCSQTTFWLLDWTLLYDFMEGNSTVTHIACIIFTGSYRF